MTLLRNSAGSMCYFTSYNLLRQQLTKLNNNQETSPIILVSGGVAGMVYWLSIYPVDVVKTRLQTDSLIITQRQYTVLFSMHQIIIIRW
jgi:solute carrier family 25 carnitine/acylcarnitine transporter 20/29